MFFCGYGMSNMFLFVHLCIAKCTLYCCEW